MNKSAAASAAVAAFAVAVGGALAQDAQNLINVQLPPQLAPEAIAAIARIGTAEAVPLSIGANLAEVIERRCGSADPSYIALLLQTNNLASEDIHRLPQARTITFPACARRVVESFPREINIFQAQGTDRKQPDKKPRTPDTTVDELENKPVWTTLRLKDGITPETARAELSTNGAIFEDAAPASLISSIGNLTRGRCGDEATRPRNWPFDPEKLLGILGLNREVPDRPPRPPTTVLILDTGFDFIEKSAAPAYPTRYITHMRPYRTPYAGKAEKWGVDLAGRRDIPTSHDGHSERWHGAGVAGVVLGGRPLEQLRRAFDLPVRVAFANVIKKRQDGQGFLIEPTVMEEAYGHATGNNIEIVNVSLLFKEGTPLTNALFRHGRKVLLVAAAGNDSRLIDSARDLPGFYGGGRHSGLVITVGAHDEDGTISPFSRHSAEYLDLLAPGCNIPTYAGMVEEGTIRAIPANLDGTSFAAPLVSMVAALLRAEGLDLPEIKLRLLQSVDVRNDLDAKVYSRGLLNIEKALAVHFDIVETERNGRREILFGRIDNHADQTVAPCAEESRIAIKEIAKLAFAPDKQGRQQAHIWKVSGESDAPEKAKRMPLCEATGRAKTNFEFEFKDAPNKPARVIKLSDVVDFVPHAR